MKSTVLTGSKTTAIRGEAGSSASADLDPHALLDALCAVRDGDFRTRLRVDGEGVTAQIATAFNEMVERNAHLAGELERVRRVVGRDGRLSQRLDPGAGTGSWRVAVDAANSLLDDLVRPTIEVGRVLSAVAGGDLSHKIDLKSGDRPPRGEFLRIARTVNGLVDRLSAFTTEVTRVAREVGTEGNLGEQARVRGVSGSWKDLADSVNSMASNLAAQVRDIAQVTTAVARGDLSRKVTVRMAGEMLELKSTVNTMVDQLSAFASEVTRVAREVGTEGNLGGQAQVWGVSGTWKDLTDSVNSMASNLTAQVRDIARVATAVARGDLTQKITVDVKGELLELKSTVNTMVDQLSAFASEVTRVAREVGTDGRLGGQALVPGVSGTWRDLTDSVNSMAGNLTSQVRNIAQVTTAVARGNLTQKITVDARGEIQELKNTINTMVDRLSAFADEVTRVAREVGTEGQLGGQALVRGVSGTWKDLTDSVNVMADNLTSQVRNIAQVATAVARGDLTQKITVQAQGEVAALAQTINVMVQTLRAFADEVTRVAREVGTEGNLGGQAAVPNVAGTWKDLTDSVNVMADNLTNQVRSIAQVTTAVALGDLTQKIDVAARGEILALKTTINTMVDTLRAFADEVTRVAREVGSEGRLGGQAEVEGVAGTWERLTESVNELAGNLTTQVRAIAEVATAVTRGDLTRQITVDASGEVAELKDNINQMIGNLAETTRTNLEQDWLKTNLARISGLMQGHRDLTEVAQLIMNELTPVVDARQGAFFLADQQPDGEVVLRRIAGYAHLGGSSTVFRLGESLVGQAALEKRRIVLVDAPPNYLAVRSGLGGAAPTTIVVMPVLFEGDVLAVIELASFHPLREVHLAFLDQLTETIGVIVNTIIVNSRTAVLLTESQRLTQQLQERSEQLQAQQEELRKTNTELEEKAALLAEQNRAIEVQNFEIEQARQSLQDRAEQLAMSSRYKSEFLANMSHELRTPLNSLLILARLLADNPSGNLTAKQVEFAEVIHGAGSDLLQLINDILDLSKVEAGKVEIRPGDVPLVRLVDYVEATFRPLTVDKGLRFTVSARPGLPPVLYTDQQRLQQVLRNLLSNAVKFTESGEVTLTIYRVEDTRSLGDALRSADQVVAFSVTDTGIGIAEDKLRTIFEAFQQADGTTSRRYGGTGLGLSISREIARLIGGEIHARSTPGSGSVFTLYIPVASYPGPGPTSGPETLNFADPLDSDEQQVPAGSDRPRRATPPNGQSILLDEPEQADRQADETTTDTTLHGRRVLIVDDDVRNVFALTSVLEEHGMEVLYAENGQVAITVVDQNPDIDLVLMDIMMPGMDGYATTDTIRRRPEFADLPIVALTAKAMKGDREKALAAGASDYVTKPVQVTHLLSVIRSWLTGPATR